MQETIPLKYWEKPTRAGLFLAKTLERDGRPVLSYFELFRIIHKMYTQSEGKKLYLRQAIPTKDDFTRLRLILKDNNFIGPDPDYGSNLIRVMIVPDLPAENIVCLADPSCYISHLSAMQRWGLTDRTPASLLLTRPDRETAKIRLNEIRNEQLNEGEENPFSLSFRTHPNEVRRRPIKVLTAKNAGKYVTDRRDNIRLSTIGQTFLDMLQKPDLCGGMAHVIEVWTEHAETHLNEIVEAVNDASSDLVKSRAGYILEEQLNLKHKTIEKWKELGQRGSSRKLDPSNEFAPTFSETWMISLNV